MAEHRTAKAVLAAPVVGAQVGLGWALTTSPFVAVVAAGSVVCVIALVIAPSVALVAVLPSAFGYWRVGPESVNISLADVVLAAAMVAAFPFVPWTSRALRGLLRVLVIYLMLLTVAVAAVPSGRAIIEVAHRGFLVGASVAVGAAVSARGLQRPALRAFVVTAVIVSVRAALDAVGSWSASGLPPPSYPFGIHKNAAGFLIACALLLLIVARREVAVPRALRAPVLAILFAGVLGCQSRGSALTLVVILLLWGFTQRRLLLSPTVLAGAALLVGMTYVTVNATFQSDQVSASSNSINSRLETYNASLDLWRTDPVVGVGLKFWRDPALQSKTAFGEPHDLVVSALAESGAVGLAALVVLIGGTLIVLRRHAGGMVAATALIFVAKSIDSVFGIFWVAGTLTLPWVLVGMTCLAPAREPADLASVPA